MYKDFPEIKQLWKIVKVKGLPGRRHVQIQMCGDCENSLFEDKSKFIVSEEAVQFRISLCYHCAKRNINATTSYMKKYSPRCPIVKKSKQ
jgi:hypothetical protein